MSSDVYVRQSFLKYFRNFTHLNITEFDNIIGQVQEYAFENGLSDKELILITSVGLKQKLAITRFRKLILSLIPSTIVPEVAVRNVLEWLLENYNQKTPVQKITVVLQWLAGLVEYKLVTTQDIDLYYNLYFHFVPLKDLNKPACKLIYLLTKPSDVNRWYVKRLLRVHENYNKPTYTGALLYLFKTYRPDCVPENIQAHAFRSAFSHSLPNTLESGFNKAKDRIAENSQDDSSSNIRRKMKDNKKSIQLIPNGCDVSQYVIGCKSLMTISSIAELHKYDLSLKTPNRVLFLLSETAGYHVLTFSDKTIQMRFCYQLYYTLYEAFLLRNPLVLYDDKEHFLKKLSLFQMYLNEGIPVVSKFLKEFFIYWDGLEHKAQMYRLMQWIDFTSFEELHDNLLTFAYDKFISGTPQTKADIVEFLGNFATNIIAIYRRRIKLKESSIFLDTKVEWNFEDVIMKLYKYINKICLLGLYLENSHSLIVYSVLQLNEKILAAEFDVELNIWNISPYVCYCAFFSYGVQNLRNICRLFNRYPDRVEKSVKTDFVNCLGHETAFSPLNGNSIFSNLSENKRKCLDRIPNADSSLSLQNHFALACYNYQLLEKFNQNNNFIEFIKCAQLNYEEVLTFLGNEV